MQSLKVVRGSEWSIDAVTQKFAWLGRTGSGKTYGCKRFVEQMLRATAQVLIADSVGVWSGLRLGPKGFDIPVLGGLHGDIPLEPTAGELVAEVAIKHNTSMVLDTSQMNDAQRARFMESFGRRLFELKKADPGALHIVLDEGQDVVPQNPQTNENGMLHEWVRIAKQGRAFGIGLSIVSQRPQELNKKALNQAECVLAFQLTGPQERKALEYWLSDKGLEAKQLEKLLPTLEVGKPFIWSPQWLKVAAVSDGILPIDSVDTSQTPKVGDKRVVEREMRPVDLGALRASMASMVEEVKENDPKALKARIKELEAQVAVGGEGAADFDMKTAKQLVMSVRMDRKITADQAMKAVGLVMDVEEILRALHVVLDRTKSHADEDSVASSLSLFFDTAAAPDKLRPLHEPIQSRKPLREKSARVREEPTTERSSLPTGEAAVLKAAFQYGDRSISVAAIALMTGYKARSIQNYVVSLSSKGYVERTTPGRILITHIGCAMVPAGVKAYPRGKKLIEHLVNTLPDGESRVLGVIAAAHPNVVAVSDIAGELDYAPRSIQNYVVSLVSRNAVKRAGSGKVQLHPEMFG